MYKMLVLDMDGTLLDHNHQISRENFKAIQEAVKRGVKIILASGRMADGIHPYLEELGLIKDNNYFVACSGAVIQNNTRTRKIEGNTLNFKDLKYIYNLANELNIGLSVYTDDSILIFYDDIFSKFDAIVNNVPLKLQDFNTVDDCLLIAKINLVDNGINGLKKTKEFFSSIVLPGDDLKKVDKRESRNTENHVFEDISKLPRKLLEKYTVVRAMPFAIEIINKDCNKWNAVKRIASELNIKDEEIICVGDSENDIHMIKNAGLGVAMGNAFPNVKRVSDFITYTNQENGVAHVIDKFILQKESLQAV